MAKPGDDQLRGFQLSVAVDGVTVSCTNGICFVPDTGRVYSAATLSAVGSGTSVWRHVYIFANSAGVPGLEVSATVPDVPYQGTARTKTGDVSRRYLGSVYFDSTGKITPFFHSQFGGQNNRIDYMSTLGISSTAAAILNAGISQTATVISASAVAPTTCRLLHAQVINTAALPAYISNPDLGAVSTASYLRFILGNNSDQMELMLDSLQRFSYIFGAGVTLGGNLTVRAIGYVFDR